MHDQTTIHPQLREKALVDLLNIVDVQNDRIELHKQQNSSALRRLLNHVNGRAADNQAAMQENTNRQLSAVVDVLTDFKQWSIQSDLAVEKIAECANKLTSAAMRLQERIDGHEEVITQFRETLSDMHLYFDEEVIALRADIQRLDYRGQAKQQMDHVLSKWDNDQYAQYPLLHRAYVVADELRWGHFGTHIRHLHADNRSTEFEVEMDTLYNEIEHRFKREMGNAYELDQLISVRASWLCPVDESQPEQPNCLGFLSDWAEEARQPLTWGLHAVLDKTADVDTSLTLPRVAPLGRFVSRVLHEQLAA